MLLCLWRYFVLPAISIAIVHGCQMRLPVKVFNRDPVFVSVSEKPCVLARAPRLTLLILLLGVRACEHRHQPPQYPSTRNPSSRLYSPLGLRPLHHRLCRLGLQYLDPWLRYFVRKQF